MNLLNTFKIIWWLVCLIFLPIIFYSRYNAILIGLATPIDFIILIIWISILLAPFFQKVDFFGLKAKKENQASKIDLYEQIQNLKAEIQNRMESGNQIDNTIDMPSSLLSSDTELASAEEHIVKSVKDTMKKRGITTDVPGISTVSDELQYLFSVKFTLEKELKRLWRSQQPDEPEVRLQSMPGILRGLIQKGVIDLELSNAIRDVLAVCTAAIRGEDISPVKFGFVGKVAPELATLLKTIN